MSSQHAQPKIARLAGRRDPTPLATEVWRLRARGVFACDIAAAVGVSASLLSRWASGRTQPSAEMRERVAALLETPVAELFPGHPSNDGSPAGEARLPGNSADQGRDTTEARQGHDVCPE